MSRSFISMAQHYLDETLRKKCPNTGKYGPEKTPYLNTFCVANITKTATRTFSEKHWQVFAV